MDALVRTYDGEDLVIPRKEIEALGLKPGEKVEIRPAFKLLPRRFPPEELERRRAIIARLTGIWSSEDEEAFRKSRRELWATWQPRDWS